MITAVVLAAGRSRRMGTQKLLLPVGDRPLIAVVVDQVLGGGLDRVVVVTGRDGDLIVGALEGRPVSFAANPDPEGEMLSSVRSGLRALPAACSAALIVLGDQPGITSAMVSSLVKAGRLHPGSLIVPVCHGRRGHPLVLSMIYREEILTGHDEVGLRGLLRSHPECVVELPVACGSLLEDLDVPADYERWIARQRRGQASTASRERGCALS